MTLTPGVTWGIVILLLTLVGVLIWAYGPRE